MDAAGLFAAAESLTTANLREPGFPETTMDHTLDGQPTKQEMQTRLREMLSHIRRSVAATSEPSKLTGRAPRQTLPTEPRPHR